MQGLAISTPESRQMFQRAIDTGRGGIHLKLTRHQFHDLAERLSTRVLAAGNAITPHGITKTTLAPCKKKYPAPGQPKPALQLDPIR
jgi:hypothetical protein